MFKKRRFFKRILSRIISSLPDETAIEAVGPLNNYNKIN